MALKWCPTAIFAFFSVIEMQQHFRKGHLETGASHEGKPLGEYLEVSLQSRDPSKHWATASCDLPGTLRGASPKK